LSGSATYLYAVARTPVPSLPLDLRGVSEAPVRFVSEGDLTCVVSTVDLDEFGEEPLGRNLEDLDWLARVAREHDAVVHEMARSMTIVPLRLATVYTDDASALRRVGELRATALATLDVLEGREEWGVKMYAVPQAPATVGAAAPRPVSGVEYLRRRRAELDQRSGDAVAAANDADAVFEQLRQISVIARQHRPQDPALSGVTHPMVLNAAFLVDRTRSPEFCSEVDAVASQRPEGAVVLTGPWPPYSFATLDEP
jgi:hypothetical protein